MCVDEHAYLEGLHGDGFAVTHGERRRGAWRGQTHVLESFQSLRGQRERRGEPGGETIKRENKKSTHTRKDT